MFPWLGKLTIVAVIWVIVTLLVWGALYIAIRFGSNQLGVIEPHVWVMLPVPFIGIAAGLIAVTFVCRGKPMSPTEILNKLLFR